MIATIIADFVLLLSIYFIHFCLFRRRTSFLPLIFAVLISFALMIAVISYSTFPVYIKVPLYVLFAYLSQRLLYEGTRRKLFWVTYVVAASLMLISLMFSGFLYSLIRLWGMPLEETRFAISQILTMLFCFGTALFFRYKGILWMQIQPKYVAWLLLFMTADAGLVISVEAFFARQESLTHMVELEILYVLGIGIVLSQVISLIAIFYSRNELQQKHDIAVEYLRIQREYTSLLQEKEQDMRAFRHDMKSHLHMLEHLWNTGKEDVFAKYLKSLVESSSQLEDYVDVGDVMLSCVLSRYSALASENQVKLQLCGGMPRPLALSAMDICTIFSNYMSNAIEAAAGTDDRVVRMDLHGEGDMMLFQICNAYNGSIVEQENCILTSKENFKDHGYGLANAGNCIEKNGGTVDITYDNQMFVVRGCLKMEEDVHSGN